jgi:hypothetical protein
VKQQLSIKAKPNQKHAAGCWESSGNGRAVVARAGPGPLTEIEPDLQEDPVDKWRTNGVSPVCRSPPRSLWDTFIFLLQEHLIWFLVLVAVLSEEIDNTGMESFFRMTLCMECMTATTPLMKAKVLS